MARIHRLKRGDPNVSKEIEKHRDAISRLSGSMRGSVVVDTLGGRQEMAAISEAGVYKLVFTKGGYKNEENQCF